MTVTRYISGVRYKFGAHCILDHIYPSKLFDTGTRLFFFACLNDAAGAALKNAAPGSDHKKSGSGSGAALKWRLQAAPAPQHWLKLICNLAHLL